MVGRGSAAVIGHHDEESEDEFVWTCYLEIYKAIDILLLTVRCGTRVLRWSREARGLNGLFDTRDDLTIKRFYAPPLAMVRPPVLLVAPACSVSRNTRVVSR